MLIRAIPNPASGRHDTRAAGDAQGAATDRAGARGRDVELARGVEVVPGNGSWRRALCRWLSLSLLSRCFVLAFIFFNANSFALFSSKEI